MRRSLLLVCLFVSACASPHDAVRRGNPEEGAGSETEAIFRYAQFGPDWTVRLGEPFAPPPKGWQNGRFEQGADGGYQVGFTYQFDAGPVPIIASIQTGRGDTVRTIRFDYGSGYDFAAEASNYREMLGAPARRDSTAGRTVLVWEDDVTRFELVREGRSEGAPHYSLLRDLDLSAASPRLRAGAVVPEDVPPYVQFEKDCTMSPSELQGEAAVLYVDGKRLGPGYETGIRDIDPESIEAITVFKCESIVEDVALRGVVVMRTKKGSQ